MELPQTHEDAELARHEQAVIELLTRHPSEQPWWLGYLDTGASDVVFPYTPRTTIYCGDGYVLVEAGPQQATNWRQDRFSWRLPELMFPADRSWLVWTMWDDSWSSIGGPARLIDCFPSDATLRTESQTGDPRTELNAAGSRDDLTNAGGELQASIPALKPSPTVPMI